MGAPPSEIRRKDDGNSREKALENDDADDDNPFIIDAKHPSIERLKKWRQATLTVNATRRFRYTLDLKKLEERTRFTSPAAHLRAASHVIRAVERFKTAGRNKPEVPPEGFGVGPQTLVHLLQDREYESLQKLGGVENVATALRTNLEDGFSDTPEEIQKRKEAFGDNTYPKKQPKGFLTFVWEACHDTTLIILMVAAVVSLGTSMWADGAKDGWYDGTAIAFAVLLVITVTAFSDYKQSLQFRRLNEEKGDIQLAVVRGGRRKIVSIFDLVAGDIVPLSLGGQVPADGIMVEGHSLSIDESAMTGESDPVMKDRKTPFLLSGCKVQDGQGSMLVTGVGIHTEWGQVMASISEDTGEETPLQVRLNGVATFIGKVGLSVAVLVFLILFIRYFLTDFKHDKGKTSQVIKSIVDIFAIAVTIVVVAVPEGLPLAVTLTLAYSMRKMMADKALVRHLAACETMGSATTICSDKTGTLTTNKMTVTTAWIAGKRIEAFDETVLSPNIRQLFLQSLCLNTTGSVSLPEEGEELVVSGSSTESAVLSWGLKLGMNFKQIKHELPVIHIETFNSMKKRAGVVFRSRDGGVQVHWKGAAEMILDQCTAWLDSDGSTYPLTPEKIAEWRKVIEGMAALTLRCIAFAYSPIEESEVPTNEEDLANWKAPENDLILTAIAGIKDPRRPGVREAVEKCQRAGVKVRMLTGDNIFTARAIAEECGILVERGMVVEGKDFRTWDEARLRRDLENLSVMARSSPLDKLKLVRALKERGDVVAVTGDGTNDAPALHEADIGLSMGIAGTEVAKESSDIIILDDNFTSVVKVVRWGRSVYYNIQKFIQFQLTVNVVALTINLVASISSGKVPLNAVQLLWINLIMDTLGALALATEEPTDDLMERKPVGKTEPLISNVMWRNIFGQAVYQIIVFMTFTFAGKKILNLSGTSDEQTLMNNTVIFNGFVFCQVFNEINARRPEKLNVFQGIYKNYIFLSIMGITVVFQIIVVEFLNKFAQTTKLPAKWWILCILIGLISLPLGTVVKLIPVPEKPIFKNACFYFSRRKKKRQQNEAPSMNNEDGHLRMNGTQIDERSIIQVPDGYADHSYIETEISTGL
ncbi:unnamed protein product [Sphagnum troendelagicum]|uniref:Calcium-transporting ATPase n=1 Tax=Sphagnum troendelagicum TaxID=128251 RepID=A0ABP0UMD5_9BRYO